MLDAPTCFLSSENWSSKLKQSILHSTPRITQAIIAWSQRIRVPRLIDRSLVPFVLFCLFVRERERETERGFMCKETEKKLLLYKCENFTFAYFIRDNYLSEIVLFIIITTTINKARELCAGQNSQNHTTEAMKKLGGKTEPAKTPEILTVELHSLLNVGVHSRNRIVKRYGGHS